MRLQVSRALPETSSEIVTNETGNIGLDREIPKESQRLRKKYQINDDLR